MTSPRSEARTARGRTPSRGERQVDGERTRAALLDAALDEFTAKGFAGARVRDIATRAGVSKDLVAYHFGGKDGLYLAVQEAWLRREDTFSDPDLPLTELVARYLRDALTDPRPLRLLLWRGLTDPDHAPPDADPEAEDLTATRARQQHGELPDDIEPAMLRLLLLAAVAAPVAFPDTTVRLFGTSLDDPSFEERYLQGLRGLLAHLSSAAATSAQ
ncbi:TetR/AcrR family transcriptional regulator [Pseudofrankia asymbiotica]|nr:TetR/AcrR family transcriptional regulator [Pseudofrankia asymbiotica]